MFHGKGLQFEHKFDPFLNRFCFQDIGVFSF